MSNCGLSQVLNCHDLTFDFEQRTLRVNSRRVVLDTRSALVFNKLVECAGEVVSKDALLAAAWPSQLVHENSLAKAISRLRAALGGSGLRITASYGLGYVLEKAEIAAAVATQTQGSAPKQDQKKSRVPASFMPFAFATIVMATAFAAITVTNPGAGANSRIPPLVTHDAADAVATILWVDDHPNNNKPEADYLKGRKIAVHVTESTEDALRLLHMNSYQLVVSDLGRGEDRLAGLKMTKALRKQAIRVPVIIYTLRPKSRFGQEAQRRMVAEAGAEHLAVTPAEVRSKIVSLLKNKLSPQAR